MIVSFRHKFIFVAIPKTATHSFRNALRPHLGANDWEQCVLFEKKYFPVKPLEEIGHGHISCLQVKPFLLPRLWQDFFKFGVARDPFERFISYCRFINRDNDKMYDKPLETMKRIISDRSNHQKILFRPQNEFISDEDGKLMVDFVCRFENLQNDFNKVCQKLDLPLCELPKINVSDMASYEGFSDSELKEMVQQFYRRDFEMLGYQMD